MGTTKQEHKLDKSTWGQGPWQQELADQLAAMR